MRLLGVVVGAVLVLGVTPSHAQPALDKPSFTASPTELLAVAQAAPHGDWPVTLLREEIHLSYDAQGRVTRRWRLVFVVRTQAGADDWGVLSHYWQPFYQEPPRIRGRVIEPGGKVTELDLSLATEAPAVERSASVFSDRRRLELPLPRLQIGAVVEEEIITQDRVPLLAAGTAEAYGTGRNMPVESELYTVSAPVALGAKVILRGVPKSVVPRRTVSGTREVWTLRLGKREPLPDDEGWVPGEIIQRPYLGVATGKSWNAIARDYRSVVERRIADGPITLPPQLPRTPSLDTVRAIVAWLHQEIRYTGIEYGEASITPWPPAETMKRGFGDCKDKATLLVALLRQAGIRADLALLLTGPGTDIDPALPGMGVFDHAIVRARIDGRDVWIDATEDLYPVGALPPRDQGRRALVIAEDTRALQVTPKASSADSTVREVRTFELAEMGAARVTEVSRESGAFEPENRAWIRDTRAEDVRKGLARYVETEYRSKALERYTTTSPTDLGTPFEITVSATNAERAFTHRDHIEVYLFPGDVLGKLPKLLTAAEDAQTPTRRHPLELYIPHTYEIENRLLIPPGYDVPAPAPERTRKLGVMTLTETQRLDGRTLVITYRLDTGNPRMTPAELKATQAALQALGEEHVRLVIEHSGWALVDRGKSKDAIAEVEKLIRLHPKEALHHTQLAYVYLRAGAGQAARRAARKAIALEPRSADAHVVLGWVLRHDTLGREYGFDHDRAGSIAAYRKARKLDPTHVGAAADLAAVLERGPGGDAYGAGADLAGAAEAWRAAHALDDSPENALALIRVLLWDGKASEAAAIARALPESDERDDLYVAAIALSRNAADASAAVSTMRAGKERVQLLASAAGTLMQLREYARARELFAQAGTLGASTPQAKLVRQIQRQSAGPGPGRDPSSAFHDVLHAGLVTSYRSRSVWNDQLTDSLNAAIRVPGLAELEDRVGASFLWDMARSIVTLVIDGPPSGPWRVRGDIFGHELTMYVARDRGIAKVFAAPGHLYSLGEHALRLLAAGDEAGARQCMDWARADYDRGGIQMLKALRFEELWGPGLPADRDALALAASVLSTAKPGIPVLEKCVSSVRDARPICDLALGFALADARRWTELERHAIAWRPRAKDLAADIAEDLGATAQMYLGKYTEAAVAYDAVIAKDPENLPARRRRAGIAYATGQIADAIQQLEDIARRRRASASDKNNLAWVLASEQRDLARALELAQVAADREKGERAAYALNTLAVVAVELGDLHRARIEGWRAMRLARRATPGPQDWYLVGRMYEQLGLRDDAIAAYRRIASPTATESRFLPTSQGLARKRLAKLGVKLPSR